MNGMIRHMLVALLSTGLGACGGPDAGEGRKVDASGKTATDLDALPEEVLAAARVSEPELLSVSNIRSAALL
jgi:hypothetical protein